MPYATLVLPNGLTIRLVYVVEHGGIVSSYYNGIRRAWIKEDSETALQYHSKLPELIEAMMAALDGLEFDTIAMAPSSRSDAVPFAKAVTERWPDARDITAHFSKRSKKAADDGDLKSMMSSIGYTADDKEELIRSLLIVDESIATGKTAAAMIERLKVAGMGENIDVTLVACCWMKPPKT